MGGWGSLNYYWIVEAIVGSAGMTPIWSNPKAKDQLNTIKLEVSDRPSAHEVVIATGVLVDGLRKYGASTGNIEQMLGVA